MLKSVFKHSAASAAVFISTLSADGFSASALAQVSGPVAGSDTACLAVTPYGQGGMNAFMQADVCEVPAVGTSARGIYDVGFVNTNRCLRAGESAANQLSMDADARSAMLNGCLDMALTARPADGAIVTQATTGTGTCPFISAFTGDSAAFGHGIVNGVALAAREAGVQIMSHCAAPAVGSAAHDLFSFGVQNGYLCANEAVGNYPATLQLHQMLNMAAPTIESSITSACFARLQVGSY